MGLFSKNYLPLYEVLFEGHPRSYCETLSNKDIEKRAKLYKTEYEGTLSDSVSKMEKTHTPKIYFERLALAEKYIAGACVVAKYFPKLFPNVLEERDGFEKKREALTFAFVDRVIKKGGNEAAKEILKYKRELTKNEIFYITKKTAP